jgi:hypothetical protein
VLDGSPAWARSEVDATNPLAPPASRADFGRFAAAFASRYGDTPAPLPGLGRAEHCAALGQPLCRCSRLRGPAARGAVQLRSADPDALILLAALAPTVEPGGLNQSDLAYLDALYAARGCTLVRRRCGPALRLRPAARRSTRGRWLNFRRAELLRQVMLRRGDRQTPVWLSCVRLAQRSRRLIQPLAKRCTRVQATWAVDALEWARRNWDWRPAWRWAAWQPAQPAGDPSLGLCSGDARWPAHPNAGCSERMGADTPPPGARRLVVQRAGSVQIEGGWRLNSQAADPPHGAALRATTGCASRSRAPPWPLTCSGGRIGAFWT